MSSRRRVATILAKDLRSFTRDRFYLGVSVVGLIAYAALFWLLPAEVSQTVAVGLHVPDPGGVVSRGLDALEGEGLDVTVYDTPGALRDGFDEDELVAALQLPDGFLADLVTGDPTSVQVLVAGDAPPQVRTALEAGVRELAFLLGGQPPAVSVPTLDELVIGDPQSAGPQPLREQLRPLLVFLMLLVEMFALASLVASEFVHRTVTAILVTPAQVSEVLAAKTILGTALAFGQALLLALVTGTLARSPVVVTVALLLGAILVTAFGLIAGAIGKDFVAIVFWSLVFAIPLLVPAFAVLFPGTPATWVRMLPSYGLVTALVEAGRGSAVGAVGADLAALAGWCLVASVLGTVVLARRVARI